MRSITEPTSTSSLGASRMNKRKPAHIKRRARELTGVFIENVRAIMETDGWTAGVLAGAMGISERKVFVLLSGRFSPKLATIVHFANVLGVKEIELLREPRTRGSNSKK